MWKREGAPVQLLNGVTRSTRNLHHVQLGRLFNHDQWHAATRFEPQSLCHLKRFGVLGDTYWSDGLVDDITGLEEYVALSESRWADPLYGSVSHLFRESNESSLNSPVS